MLKAINVRVWGYKDGPRADPQEVALRVAFLRRRPLHRRLNKNYLPTAHAKVRHDATGLFVEVSTTVLLGPVVSLGKTMPRTDWSFPADNEVGDDEPPRRILAAPAARHMGRFVSHAY